MIEGKIVRVAGPLVVAEGLSNAKMFDMVRVGDMGLIGEIIELRGDKASIQVYEETSGIGVGQKVISTGEPLVVELGPGLIENIYDGIQRPLSELAKNSGAFISRGLIVPALDRSKKWDFKPLVKTGDVVTEGDIIGEVQETSIVNHKIMVPPGVSGKIVDIKKGSFTVEEVVAVVENDKGEKINVKMYQKWPVRIGRPYKNKINPKEPLFTGQRVVDAFFPYSKGWYCVYTRSVRKW